MVSRIKNGSSIERAHESNDSPKSDSMMDKERDLVIIGNSSFQIESINAPALELLGEIVGRECYSALRGRTSPCEDCPFSAAHVSDRNYSLVYSLKLPGDSNICFTEVIISADPLRWVAIGRKESPRREEPISLSELSSSFDAMGDGVCLLDPTGKIIDSNAVLNRIYGFSEGEIIGADFTLLLPEERRSKLFIELSNELKNGRTERVMLARRKDNSEFWAWLKIAQVRSREGTLLGYLGTVRDITNFQMNRIQLEDEVLRLEKQLENGMLELTKRMDQLRILQELGKRVALSKNEEEIASSAAHAIVDTLNYTAAGIVFMSGSPDKRTFQLLGSHARIAPGKYGKRINEQPILKAIKSKAPVIERYPRDVLSVGALARSELVVPLISQDRIFGAIVIADPKEDRFNPDDVSIASSVADIVSISLTNTVTNRQLQDRTQALNLLDEVTLQAISTMDVGGILSETAQRINRILGTQSCLIGMVSSDGGVDWMAIEGAEEFADELRRRRYHDDYMKRIIEAGSVFYTNDYSFKPSPLIQDSLSLLINSFLVSPIRLMGATIGVIVLINKQSPSGFTDQDASLVQNFSDHLAVLIHNAETMASLNYSLRTMKSLLRTTFDLQVAAGVSDIYQKVSDMLLEVVPYDAARFYAIREEGLKAVLSRNLGEKIELSIAEDRVLDLVAKALTELRGFRETHSVKKSENEQEQMISILTIPLIGREDAIGAIVIARSAEKGFSDQDIEVATLFANHAAIALENARLLAKEKEMLNESLARIRHLESILDLSTSVISMGRGGGAINRILSGVSSILGFSKCLILSKTEHGDDMVCSGSIGFGETESRKICEPSFSTKDMIRLLENLGTRLGDRVYHISGTPTADPMKDESSVQFAYKAFRDLMISSSVEKFFYRMDDANGNMNGVMIFTEGPEGIANSKGMIGLLEIYGNLASIAMSNERLLNGEIRARSEIEALNDLMTHDINNFTQGVLGYLEIISMAGESDDKIKDYSAKAIEQVENTKHLIENVRRLAEIRASGSEGVASHDIAAVIDASLQNIKSEYPNKIVKFNSDVTYGKIFIPGDKHVKDLFSNLFSNAIKFTPSAEVIIDLNVSSHSEFGKDYWRIEIIDHGRGIPDEKKQKVLERFSSTGKDEARPYGFGIGLTIVKNLVIKYGGRIWIENRVSSDYRKGTKFVLLLPKAKPLIEEQKTPQKEPVRKSVKTRKMKQRPVVSKEPSFQRVLRQPRQGRSGGEKAS
ncbi:MAG: GAF domain-containing protein [Thermoplasmata archaeon]